MPHQDVAPLCSQPDGGSRYLGREAIHLDASASHDQWRAEQMSAYGEVYSSWRHERDRKAQQDAAWPSPAKTLFPA